MTTPRLLSLAREWLKDSGLLYKCEVGTGGTQAHSLAALLERVDGEALALAWTTVRKMPPGYSPDSQDFRLNAMAAIRELKEKR